ncbi:MAG TPA: hypothetical protein VNT60_08430 [Deinococcales bacterium]|nr:hypothetical protein [Deinococcales bacterium]
MKRALLAAAAALVLSLAPALAHGEAMYVTAEVGDGQLALDVKSDAGPISLAVFNATIIPTGTDRVDVTLSEEPRGSGRYVGGIPQLPPGPATLIVRDRTEPGENREAQVEVQWPPSDPISLEFEEVAPPPNFNLIIAAILLPVLVGALVVGWAVMRGRGKAQAA